MISAERNAIIASRSKPRGLTLALLSAPSLRCENKDSYSRFDNDLERNDSMKFASEDLVLRMEF